MPIRRDYAPSPAFNFSNGADPYNFGLVNSEGDLAVIYVGTIYVDDQPFEVQLDTGSGDLWVDGSGITFNNAENTHISGRLSYGDNSVVEGDIYIATVKFGDFTIDKQAFINTLATNATTGNDKGLLGIAPPSQSGIFRKLNNTGYNGAPLLENIFAAYPNESKILTMQLSRSDLGMVDGGVFTIGEIDSNFTAVTNSSKLEVIPTLNMWHTLMDGITVNGQYYSGHGNSTTRPANADPSSLVILLDSGTASTTLPSYYVDLIYKNIPGVTTREDIPGLYQLPCDTKLNVSLIFAGQEYPIHPLDVIAVTSSDDDKTAICVGTLQYSSTADTRQDAILGDSFMRNVYSLFNLGNFTTGGDVNPYIQLLSVTSKDQAWLEFDTYNEKRINQWKATKLNGTTTSTATPTPSASVTVAGNVAADDSTSTTTSPDLHTLLRNSYAIIGMLVVVFVLLFIVAVLLFRNHRNSRIYNPVGNPISSLDYKRQSGYEKPYDS
ncbi:aspartic peptidase domain-containing protein [Abortiporus biennis]|nr:aspartic peptidase domain-containing protein [Abortiporus biennis]